MDSKGVCNIFGVPVKDSKAREAILEVLAKAEQALAVAEEAKALAGSGGTAATYTGEVEVE